MNLADLLSYDWAVRALWASGMVGIVCGTLGCFIVLRNMALIGDALSHAILPGVVISFMIVGYSAMGFFLGSVIAGLVTAIMITWIQQNVQTKNDAAIGIIFTFMFSIGVMSISYISRNEGVHLDLKDFLFGNVLGISDQDLMLTTIVTMFVVLSLILFYRHFFITTFQPTIANTMGISTKWIHYFLMLLLSFAIVASLQTVGVILVVAMLITPPSTAILWSNRLHWVIPLSGLIGLISAVSGFFAAVYFETTPGPAMAVASTLFYGVSILVAPEKGLLSKARQKRKQREKILDEDVLKHSLKIGKGRKIELSKLSQHLGVPLSPLLKSVRRLNRSEMIEMLPAKTISLTSKGIARANALVRAHRLWETFLVEEIGLHEGQIHEDAERIEHLLSEEDIDEMDASLGYPVKDPHGSPIPLKPGQPSLSILNCKVGDIIQIAFKQEGEIISDLWKMGFLPETEYLVSSKDKDFIFLATDGNIKKLDVAIGKYVSVRKI